jgi:hypothetical protein
MRTIDLRQYDDCDVLHFDTEGRRLNAYTLASTLVSLADAAKAANDVINHGYDVEIVVEALGAGSFRAKLRAVYRKHHNLFSKEVGLALVVGVLGNYIYERTLAVRSEIKVEIHTDEVIIQTKEEKLIVSRVVYDATRQAERAPRFVTAVARTFEALKDDPKIEGFGLVKEMSDPPPEIMVTKNIFPKLGIVLLDEPDGRIVTENVDLQIIKAILERGERKWEFSWRGIKISAPITHGAFYEQFDAHHITIAPGDILQVRLAISQRRDSKTGIYANVGYEVVEVFQHIPRVRQTNLPGPE